jgi:hypothetical protein
MNARKARIFGYWASTGLLALSMVGGGIMDLAHGPQVVAMLRHLGYPMVVATMLGIWKLLGALALLAPRLPRLKEWAYAGVAFDFIGAIASHASVGDCASAIVPPIVLLAIAVASWTLRPESRLLRSPGTDEPGAVGSPSRTVVAHT